MTLKQSKSCKSTGPDLVYDGMLKDASPKVHNKALLHHWKIRELSTELETLQLETGH